MPTSPAAVTPLPALTAPALKAQFKANCAGLGNSYRNWQVRVHRAISWLGRAEELGADDRHPEARFLYLWIALNSLYSRWNAERNMPDADGASRLAFFRTVYDWDGARMADLLRRHRATAKKVLQNPYVAFGFWKHPEHPKAKGWATEDANHLDHNLRDGNVRRVVEQVIDRLFVLRGQIVHGASTGGSRLNRASLAAALRFLEAFVPTAIDTVIEHGRNDDWPELCYPPVA